MEVKKITEGMTAPQVAELIDENFKNIWDSIDENRYGFNVTVYGLKGGSHNIETAIRDVPPEKRTLGQKVTFLTIEGFWVTYQNQSLSLNEYTNERDWVQETGISTVEGGININNNPDNEDLTATESGQLKLADKEFSKSSFSGFGRVFLRKNIVDGNNVLTQGMLAKENTRYIIQYDYDLQGEDIIIPKGCVLDFQGGSLDNGNLDCNNCYIESNINSIFRDINLSGEVQNCVIESCWFSIDLTGETDCTDILQRCANFSVSNVKPLNLTNGIYKISNSIVFQNGNWGFRGINGNNSTIVVESESSIPAILVPNGSGREAMATIRDLKLKGNALTTGIELRGACQVFVENCYFYDNRYGVVYSNDVGSGTFTEGCIVEKSRFAASCLTALRYYRGAGNDSFHGSGIKDCWIDTPSDYPAIEIGERCLPYNAPLDFRCLKQGSDAVITRVATADIYPNFYGSISIEAYSCTICSGGNVFFMGTINVLGRATNGTLSVCERIEKRGPNYNNVAAFIPKDSTRAGNIEAGASIEFNSSFIWVINFPNGHANIEVRTTRPSHGGNAILAAPIVCYNQAWIESNITITMADGKFKITNKSSASVRYIAIGTYNNPDPYSYYF